MVSDRQTQRFSVFSSLSPLFSSTCLAPLPYHWLCWTTAATRHWTHTGNTYTEEATTFHWLHLPWDAPSRSQSSSWTSRWFLKYEAPTCPSAQMLPKDCLVTYFSDTSTLLLKLHCKRSFHNCVMSSSFNQSLIQTLTGTVLPWLSPDRYRKFHIDVRNCHSLQLKIWAFDTGQWDEVRRVIKEQWVHCYWRPGKEQSISCSGKTLAKLSLLVVIWKLENIPKKLVNLPKNISKQNVESIFYLHTISCRKRDMC